MNIVNFLRERSQALAQMHHLDTQEIVENVYAIKTKGANFFIVGSGEGEYIAIDAGGGNKSVIAAELAKLNIEPEKVRAAFLTHTDFDHVAALGLFKNATIYLSEQEVQMIDGTTSRLPHMGKSRLNRTRLDHSYTTIEDGEELCFGDLGVKCILTPGHTEGSMSFLINGTYLFVGDSLSLSNGRVDLFNSTFNISDDVQRQSLRNLAKIQGIQYVFTAHYGFSDHYVEAFKDFV